MKILPLILLSCPLLFATLEAAEINAQGKITSVTVYPGSAKVLRHASANLPPGNSSILITGLPLNLQESSLRVSGKGDQPVILSSVSLHREIHTEVVLEQEKQLRQQIEQQHQLAQQIEDGKQQHLQQIAFINAMGTGGKGDKPSSYLQLPPEQWQQAWTLMQESTAHAQQQIRRADEQSRLINKRIKQLQAQLKQIATNQRSSRSALLEVKAARNTHFEIELSYQVGGARWTPVYDAYLDTKTGKLQLRSLAQISQRTGEDWNDVQVTLSTLRPTSSTKLPRLDSWVIDFYTPPQPVAANMERVKRKSMPLSAPPMEGMGMTDEQVELVATDYSAEYQLPTSISLDSGSDKRRFALSSKEFDANIELASVPRLDPRAMLTGKITYQSDAPLLAGSISLYRDGSFVGNTYLEETQSGEEIRLSFGEDDKVKIKFHPDPDRKKQSGLLFGKRKVVERNYLLSIHNNHQDKKTITLHESLPVAADEQIKVEPSGEKPDDLNVDEKKGVVSWIRQLPAGKEVQLRYGYNVTYPNDREVEGL